MTRVLKTSGFLGLATMMAVGLHQFTILAGGGAPPSWMIGGHAHLGVLSILAVVVGFVVEAYALEGRLRTAVTAMFVAGQWGIPGVVWIGEGLEVTALMPTAFLWGLSLIVSMLLLAYVTATETATFGESESSGVAPADD